MKKEIKENEYNLQYFEDKKRILRTEIKSLHRKLLRKTRYSPRNYLNSLYHNDEVEHVLAQIDAYELRLDWCNVNIKTKKEKSKSLNLLNQLRVGFQKLESKLLQEEVLMQNYFAQQETRAMQNKFRFYNINAA